MDRSRLFGHLSIGLSVGLLVAVLWLRFPYGLIPGDAFSYLAAGERLNAGHPLYALSPGDRPVWLEPPYWSVPLLSPPLVAVVFRPLASLPWDLGVYLWWALHIAAIATSFILVAARRPVLASAGLLVLLLPFAYELSVANLNGFVLLGLILTWRATVTGHERAVGALAAVLSAFKVVPILLGWWLLTARRWSALRSYVLVGLALLAVSLVGAGLDSHLAYVSVMGETAAGGARPMSLGGIARFIGIAPQVANLLPVAALLVGFGVIWSLRRRPDRAFVAAVVTMIAGSPTIGVTWFVLLFATLAPLAWPWPPIDHASTGSSGASPDQAAREDPAGVRDGVARAGEQFGRVSSRVLARPPSHP